MTNIAVIEGRLTADPVLRQTQSGKSVASFTIACERDFPDRDGNKGADFLDIVTWEGTADFVHKYIGKGRLVQVEGCFQQRKWVDKNGNNRNTVEVKAERVRPRDSKPAVKQETPGQEPPAQETPRFENVAYDDGLPF